MKTSELVQIADILPPVAPASTSDNIWFYVLLLTLFIALASFRYLRSSKQQFKLRLRRLRRQYQQHKLNNRQCAFHLTRLLCQKLQIPRLSASALSQHQNSKAWQEYVAALHVARFSRQGLNDDAMKQLLVEAESWLQQRS